MKCAGEQMPNPVLTGIPQMRTDICLDPPAGGGRHTITVRGRTDPIDLAVPRCADTIEQIASDTYIPDQTDQEGASTFDPGRATEYITFIREAAINYGFSANIATRVQQWADTAPLWLTRTLVTDFNDRYADTGLRIRVARYGARQRAVDITAENRAILREMLRRDAVARVLAGQGHWIFGGANAAPTGTGAGCSNPAGGTVLTLAFRDFREGRGPSDLNFRQAMQWATDTAIYWAQIEQTAAQAPDNTEEAVEAARRQAWEEARQQINDIYSRLLTDPSTGEYFSNGHIVLPPIRELFDGFEDGRFTPDLIRLFVDALGDGYVTDPQRQSYDFQWYLAAAIIAHAQEVQSVGTEPEGDDLDVRALRRALLATYVNGVFIRGDASEDNLPTVSFATIGGSGSLLESYATAAQTTAGALPLFVVDQLRTWRDQAEYGVISASYNDTSVAAYLAGAADDGTAVEARDAQTALLTPARAQIDTDLLSEIARLQITPQNMRNYAVEVRQVGISLSSQGVPRFADNGIEVVLALNAFQTDSAPSVLLDAVVPDDTSSMSPAERIVRQAQAARMWNVFRASLPNASQAQQDAFRDELGQRIGTGEGDSGIPTEDLILRYLGSIANDSSGNPRPVLATIPEIAFGTFGEVSQYTDPALDSAHRTARLDDLAQLHRLWQSAVEQARTARNNVPNLTPSDELILARNFHSAIDRILGGVLPSGNEGSPNLSTAYVSGVDSNLRVTINTRRQEPRILGAGLQFGPFTIGISGNFQVAAILPQLEDTEAGEAPEDIDGADLVGGNLDLSLTYARRFLDNRLGLTLSAGARLARFLGSLYPGNNTDPFITTGETGSFAVSARPMFARFQIYFDDDEDRTGTNYQQNLSIDVGNILMIPDVMADLGGLSASGMLYGDAPWEAAGTALGVGIGYAGEIGWISWGIFLRAGAATSRLTSTRDTELPIVDGFNGSAGANFTFTFGPVQLALGGLFHYAGNDPEEGEEGEEERMYTGAGSLDLQVQLADERLTLGGTFMGGQGTRSDDTQYRTLAGGVRLAYWWPLRGLGRIELSGGGTVGETYGEVELGGTQGRFLGSDGTTSEVLPTTMTGEMGVRGFNLGVRIALQMVHLTPSFGINFLMLENVDSRFGPFSRLEPGLVFSLGLSRGGGADVLEAPEESDSGDEAASGESRRLRRLRRRLAGLQDRLGDLTSEFTELLGEAASRAAEFVTSGELPNNLVISAGRRRAENLLRDIRDVTAEISEVEADIAEETGETPQSGVEETGASAAAGPRAAGNAAEYVGRLQAIVTEYRPRFEALAANPAAALPVATEAYNRVQTILREAEGAGLNRSDIIPQVPGLQQALDLAERLMPDEEEVSPPAAPPPPSEETPPEAGSGAMDFTEPAEGTPPTPAPEEAPAGGGNEGSGDIG